MAGALAKIQKDLTGCKICAEQFAKTATAHAPRPVVWFEESARILIAGQAPGARVHESGVPFSDRSGDRLREWTGLNEETFYDRSHVAIVPMAFCFPGYTKNGSDLPPPRICATTWRARILSELPSIHLTLLVGGYAQTWHSNGKHRGVTDTVMAWRSRFPEVVPLPHPSWRNTGWLKANSWFETELLPALRLRVQEVLNA